MDFDDEFKILKEWRNLQFLWNGFRKTKSRSQQGESIIS